jgi:hypothetical protein
VGFVFACGYCQVPLKGPADPNPDCMFKSPSCGQRETFDNVKRIVASFSGRARITIEEMLRTVGESLTYSDALLSKPVNRFIAVEIGDCLEAYALLARRASSRCRIWGGQKARRQLHLTRRPEACRGSRCDAHIQSPAPVSLGKKKSANRTHATGRSRTTITHEVVDLVDQVPHPIMLTDKAALIRNLGSTRLFLPGSNHEKHTGLPCIDRESP